MITIPTTFTSKTKSLKKEQLGPIGQAALAMLEEKGYTVEIGLTMAFAKDIQSMALQSSIQEYCPKDPTERFKDVGTTSHWLSKGKAVFLLCKREEDKKQRLAGYGWVGPKISSHVPKGQNTFGLRIGEADQGLGLAAPYTRVMLDAAIQLFGCQQLWLESWASNGGAIHTYEKLGFTKVLEESDKRLRPNNESVIDIRIYMQLIGELS